jgi:hypothetical protein
MFEKRSEMEFPTRNHYFRFCGRKMDDWDVDEDKCFLLSLLPSFMQFKDEQHSSQTRLPFITHTIQHLLEWSDSTITRDYCFRHHYKNNTFWRRHFTRRPSNKWIYCGWQLLKQVNYFKFHWCKFSHENETVIEQKLTKFSKSLGIVNNTCKPTLDQKASTNKSAQRTGSSHSSVSTRNFDLQTKG